MVRLATPKNQQAWGRTNHDTRTTGARIMSRTYERIASRLVGTPLQGAAEQVRHLKTAWQIHREPDLRKVLSEGRLTTRLMKHYIRRDMNCVDVGCHLGVMLHQITTLAPDGCHHAFEPVPYKAEWLRRKFPSAVIHEMALSDHGSADAFFVDETSSARSALRPVDRDHSLSSIKVETRRLDDVLPEDLTVGFVKIDAIGAELLVMQGAERIIKRDRPVVLFECSHAILAAFELTPADIYDYVVGQLGYQLFSLHGWANNHGPLDLAHLEIALVWPYEAFNYVALPPGAPAARPTA